MYAFNYCRQRQGGRAAAHDLRRTRASPTSRSSPKTGRLPRTIPVTKEQLEGVLDPMSGAFLTAQSENPNGDLNRSATRLCRCSTAGSASTWWSRPSARSRVKRTTPTGYGGPAVICRVKFIPIAGYQPDNPGIRLMSADERDRGLAHPGAGHQYVRALSDCVADAGGLWLGDRDLDPSREARRASAEP